MPSEWLVDRIHVEYTWEQFSEFAESSGEVFTYLLAKGAQ